MTDSLENKYILFPDKISSSNFDDYDKNYLTANNVNDIKKSINSTIDKLIEIEHFLSGSINTRISSLSSQLYELDLNSKFRNESKDFDNYVSGKIEDVLSSINILFKELNSDRKILDINSNKIEKNRNDIDEYVSGLTRSLSMICLELNDIKTSLSNLNYSSSNLISSNINFEKSLNDIKNSDSKQNILINNNIKEIKFLKDKLEEQTNQLNNLNGTSSTNLSRLLLDSGNILYYLEQINERIILQDERCDHLERLIRHIQEPPEWDDWNRVFRLLNLLKLKIGKLSITNKVPVHAVPISTVDLSEFRFILSEIERKLRKLPSDQIFETGIKIEEISLILNSLDTIQTIDPTQFEFYPLFPIISEFDDNENN